MEERSTTDDEEADASSGSDGESNSSRFDNTLLTSQTTAQFFSFLSVAADSFRMLQTLVQPPADITNSNHDTSPFIPAVVSALYDRNDDHSIMNQAPRFVEGLISSFPGFKSTEYQTLMQIVVMAAMQLRPQYFAGIETHEITSELIYSIAFKFLQEFVEEGGALDKWRDHFSTMIPDSDFSEIQMGATREFGLGFYHWLKYVGGAKGYDSEDYPLHKYMNPDDLERIQKLKSWLEANRDHPNYDTYQEEFSELDMRLRNAKMRAIEEYSNRMMGLFKNLRPDLPETEDNFELTEHALAKSQQEHIAEFVKYILGLSQNSDLLESNQLRAFRDYISRHNFSEIWYQSICESSLPENQNNVFHIAVRRLWGVYHIDKINRKPRDAMSRMPGASLHGGKADNFGYEMDKSTEHQEWQQLPLARACGDVIMDTYHCVVDLGLNLDENLITERMALYLEGKILAYVGDDPHPWDIYLPMLLKHTLEREFGIITKTLIKKKAFSELIDIAKVKGSEFIDAFNRILKEFKAFCLKVNKLKPSDDATRTDGFVFGMGFNGPLFKAPNHDTCENNEIWFTFSESGRTSGGYVALALMKDICRLHSQQLYSFINLNSIDVNIILLRYRKLICRKIKQGISSTYFLSDNDYSAEMYKNTQSERRLYEAFLSQLEMEIPFKYIMPELQQWIMNFNNWYSIPFDITVDIAPEMPFAEHQTQRLTYQLVFDVLIGRCLSEDYPELIPGLFKHWKDVILKKIVHQGKILKEELLLYSNYDGIPIHIRKLVNKQIDLLIFDTHPSLTKIWSISSINNKCINYFKRHVDTVNRKLLEKEKQKKILQKKHAQSSKVKEKLSGNDNNANIEQFKLSLENDIRKISEEITEINQELARLQPFTNQLIIPFAQMPIEVYHMFRDDFFSKNDVAQCVEPALARVVGHDRFFSVFVAQRVGTNLVHDASSANDSPLQLGTRFPLSVIEPCEQRCRFNALGHLFTGDMLSYNSADRLHQIRITHGVEGVPDRFTTFNSGQVSGLLNQFRFRTESPSPPHSHSDETDDKTDEYTIW